MQDQNHQIERTARRLNERNDELKQRIPEMDKQITILKEQLDQLNQSEITPAYILSDVLKPKDNLAEKILKCSCKEKSIQETILAFRGVDEV